MKAATLFKTIAFSVSTVMTLLFVVFLVSQVYAQDSGKPPQGLTSGQYYQAARDALDEGDSAKALQYLARYIRSAPPEMTAGEPHADAVWKTFLDLADHNAQEVSRLQDVGARAIEWGLAQSTGPVAIEIPSWLRSMCPGVVHKENTLSSVADPKDDSWSTASELAEGNSAFVSQQVCPPGTHGFEDPTSDHWERPAPLPTATFELSNPFATPTPDRFEDSISDPWDYPPSLPRPPLEIPSFDSGSYPWDPDDPHVLLPH